MTALSGVALLPARSDMERVIAFREAAGTDVNGPMLGVGENLPHITLLQCPFREESLNRDNLAQIACRVKARAGLFWSLRYQPVGWLFADVYVGANFALHDQHAALSVMEEHINRDEVRSNINTDGHTDHEAAMRLRYGYRYIGPSFQPHITVGRMSEDGDINDRIASLYTESLAGTSVVFERIVFYRAGEFGSCAEVLEQIEF